MMKSSSSGTINVAASTQKINVDNRISLRYYYRIADNILRQAAIFREEKNIIDLYIMLLRFLSLYTETIPYHRDFRASLQIDKLSLKKKSMSALTELEALKPAVQQKIDELSRKHACQSNGWSHLPQKKLLPDRSSVSQQTTINSYTINKIMDFNEYYVVDCETPNKMKKHKPKVVWDNGTLMKFIDLCLLELRKGNRSGSHFNKAGWLNLEKGMQENTIKIYAQKQLKNKWDIMKKDWKLYDRLMRLETGIGGTRRLLDASPEWWEEKIKVDKDFAKFRDANLSIYETHYAPLFRDSVAVGDQTMTRLQFQNNSNPNDVQREENMEGKGDSDEILGDDEHLFPSFHESSSSKRKKSKVSSKVQNSKTSSFEEKLNAVLDALSTISTQTFPPNNPSPTISDCMNIVITFPGFEEGLKQYSKALRVFIKKQNREAFMFPTTHEAKMEFLKLLMEE